MTFFSKYPLTEYSSFGVVATITDITRRAKVIDEFKEHSVDFVPYTVQDGERPEDVSLKFYGTPFYHWIIMLYNNIIDPYYDWPMSSVQFDKYILRRCAELGVSQTDIKHYVNDDGIILEIDSRFFINYLELDGAVTVPDELGNLIIDGTGTAFKSQLFVGAMIRVNSETAEVVEIISDTRLRINVPILNAESNVGSQIYLKAASSGTPVTYFDFELSLNEEKKQIFVPTLDAAQRIETEYLALVNS